MKLSVTAKRATGFLSKFGKGMGRVWNGTKNIFRRRNIKSARSGNTIRFTRKGEEIGSAEISNDGILSTPLAEVYRNKKG